MTYQNEAAARQALEARVTTLSDLRVIVVDYPQLRAMVAALPEVDAALLGWLADLHDPAVDAALEARPRSSAGRVPVEVAERTPASRPVVIAIAAVAVVALVAGLAVGLPRLLSGPGGGGTQGGGPGTPAQLRVTGQPPAVTGSWASGTRRVWRVDAEHVDQIEGGTTSYSDIAARTAGGWSVTDFVGDTGHAYWGLDPESGSVRWGYESYRACAKADLNGLVPCLDHARKGSSDEWEAVLRLVDWSTSKSVQTTTFTELGLGKADLNPASEVAVVDGDLVLTLPSYPDSGPELGDLAGVTVARVGADGKKARWTASNTCTGDDWLRVPGKLLANGILTPGYGIAVDFETGKPILDPKSCPMLTGRGVLRVDPSSGVDLPAQVTAPDGSMVVISRAGQSGFRLVDAAPPQPLTLLEVRTGSGDKYGSRAGTAKLTAIDPVSGKPAWATPLDVAVTVQDGEATAGAVSFDGQRLLVLEFDRRIRAVDPATGRVLWVAASPGTYGLNRTADGTLLVGNYQGTIALDPDTGAQLWSLPGDIRPAPGRDGQESLLQLTGDYVARLDPADRPVKARVVPAGAASCPAGMSPISWTRYEGGAVLVCRQEQRYVVVVADRPDWQASELAFTTGGYQVTFGNGARLRSALGGALIELVENGQPRLVQVHESWSAAAGKLTFTAPTGLTSCPAGSWPISLSVFDGGWLLVCGTGPAQPTAISYSSGGSRRDTGQVTFGNGGYCGDLGGARVCAYHAPALVTERTGASELQRSVSSDYFTGRGAGGSGKGTGSFGVDSPRDNDKDQVRYLSQILQKSRTGRSNLDVAVSQVRRCTKLTEAITTLRSVTVNREELLAALDATPLTAVPDGTLLVSRLRNALTLSRESDLVWVQWAESEQAGGCAQSTGNPLYTRVTGMNREVARAKDEFLALWNRKIVPGYGAPSFSRSQI
ncbi:MAG: PQQ-binding-like beta-propeller repeat protein [Micropruina sp.]|uniref:outer membrane protein assembly factor BamB family protein n=1 Tax=Micropruina sp. TaxID=2737536 RepID=UPI0039E3EC49